MKFFAPFLWFLFVFIVPDVLLYPSWSEDEKIAKNKYPNADNSAEPTSNDENREPPINTNQGKQEKPLVKDVGCINEIAGEIRKCIISEPKEGRNIAAFAMEVHSNWSQLAAKREENIMGKLESALVEADKCWQSIYISALRDIFVTRHYPYWLGPPPTDKVVKWQNMFLNFADEFVRAIKVILQKNGMSEDLFLEINILGTYKNIGIEVHPTHLTKEQIAIIKKCMPLKRVLPAQVVLIGITMILQKYKLN